MNYKFDENGLNNSGDNLFRINLNDLNKEFSDFDLEFNFNNWADLQTEEVRFKIYRYVYTTNTNLYIFFKFLQSLSKTSRNKQENVFEFMKTEVNYVKILTITQKVYVNVMINDCKIEQKHMQQMFPDLERLIDLHKDLLDSLMERYKISNNKYIESIGDILLEIVSQNLIDSFLSILF